MKLERLATAFTVAGRRAARFLGWAWTHPAPRRAARRARGRARELVRNGVLSVSRLVRHPRTRRTARALVRSARVLVLAGILAVLFLGGVRLCVETVPAGRIAVQQNRFGGGVVPRDFGPGLHFAWPTSVIWHYLPTQTHYLTFANQPFGDDLPLLKVRTKDGNVARVEATVPFRIREGEAHALVAAGLRSAYEMRARARIEKVLLAEFATLSSDDFTDSDVRLACARRTRDILDGQLADLHLTVESVQLHGVYFPIDYEQKLQAKQLIRQQTLLEDARREMEQRQAVVRALEARIQDAERDLQVAAENEFESVRAESRVRASAARRAAAEEVGRLEGLAIADADRLRKDGEAAIDRANAERAAGFAAVYDSPGGRAYLARQAAASLNLPEIVLDSRGLDLRGFLDPRAILELLTGATGD